MTDPKTLHVWMPDGRSLCDLRPMSHIDLTKASDEEFEEHLDTITGAPACGSCLVLGEHVRHKAVVMFRQANRKVFPDKPIVAWQRLKETRWSNVSDLDTFLGDGSDDRGLKYERIEKGLDSAIVDPHVIDWSEYERDLRAARAAHAAEPAELKP